jgi:hypothetical protein
MIDRTYLDMNNIDNQGSNAYLRTYVPMEKMED